MPVRADDHQIFTCFLDYKGDVVHVHDVLYTRDRGEWRLQISDYLKLRLDTAAINGHLQSKGLTIDRQFSERGMIHVKASKPADG